MVKKVAQKEGKKQEKKEDVIPEYKKLQDTTNLFYKDTIFAGIHNTVKTKFLVPFALAMNASNQQIAMISAAPQLMQAIFQLFSADLLNIFKNRKAILTYTTLFESILWIPLLLIPFFWEADVILLLNLVIFQALVISFINPFYNSLMGDIITPGKRGSVIGNINRITGIISFLTSIAAGVILTIFSPVNPFLGFIIIFIISFISRTICFGYRDQFYEPSIKGDIQRTSLLRFIRSMKRDNFGKFVIYDSLIKFAVGISAPFFTVYMLQELGMSFITYSLITGASIISSFLVMEKWGEELDRNGSKWMLGISGLAIPFVPVLWIFFKSSVILFITELVSGAVWAAYNLSTKSFVLDATNRKNRLVLSSFYNFFIGISTFLGAVIGGVLMTLLPKGFFGNVFLFIFGLSAVLRLFISIYYLPKIKEERFVDIKLKGPKNKRIISLDPKQDNMVQFVPRRKD